MGWGKRLRRRCMGCGERLRLRCAGFIHTIASLPTPRDVEAEEDQVCTDGRSDDCSDEGEKSAGRVEPQPGTCEATSYCCRESDGVGVGLPVAVDPGKVDAQADRHTD